MATNYNTDQLEPPKWMDKVFFERALRSYVHDTDVVVKNFESKPATKISDHFASIMFRVTIEYDSPKYKKVGKKISVILKTMPFVEGVKEDFLRDGSAFETEIRMYSKVIPEMERALAATGDDTQLGPRLVYYANDPAPIIILEDISVLGYEMVKEALDFDAAKLVAQKLAKFHAASMFIQANGMDLTDFDKTWFLAEMPNSEETQIEAFMIPTLDLLTDVVRTWEGDWSKVINKLEQSKSTFAEKIKGLYSGTNERIFSLLNHCDFHFKNMMFKNEEGKVKDLLLLDFQFCLWSSCAIDLAYLNFMVCNAEARERRIEMRQIYYDEFAGTLKKLGYLGRIPTLHDLNVEILRNGIVELMISISFPMLIRFIDFSELKSPEEIFDMKDPLKMHRVAMKNPEYQEFMKKELPRMVGLGIIG